MGRRRLAIPGDSYSTFKGCVPEGYYYWYGEEEWTFGNGVLDAEQTWFRTLCREQELELVLNCSFSGSAVSYTAYEDMDGVKTSFVYRTPRDFGALKERGDRRISMKNMPRAGRGRSAPRPGLSAVYRGS